MDVKAVVEGGDCGGSLAVSVVVVAVVVSAVVGGGDIVVSFFSVSVVMDSKVSVSDSADVLSYNWKCEVLS